ncbi:response regulator transcription factor [Fulvivirga maritima]|uniref:response regulator n=1 Tax=Fulvivirga maritima TaxID=2904247 RepID=UPI001F3CAE41|nr:response regulator transcription factor [Fulvivirga maritima]UII25542.1 response regulator transcription factor [Fulvivirga maritima]
MSKIEVIITDDHKLFRDGLRSILQQFDDIEIIGEASSESELMGMLQNGCDPDIVLMDISLPDGNGLDIIKKMKEDYGSIKCVVITMHAEGQYVVKAVKNGAYGYLLKSVDQSELVEAVKTVGLGKKYFNAEVSQLMVTDMAEEQEQETNLSERELEVLQLVAKGYTTKEIANQLYVSARTIETHRVNIMRKLQVQNSAEMITKAAKCDLI